jgi:hypothetical protein
VSGVLFFMGIVSLVGCHNPWPFAGSNSYLDNAQFMQAWETYLHCRSSSEPDEIRTDLHQLSVIARTVTTLSRPSVVLPAAIQALVTKPPSRLAVDPHAMMMACALHGGETAQFAGRPELAVELFTVVLAAQREEAPVHYPADVGRALTYRK